MRLNTNFARAPAPLVPALLWICTALVVVALAMTAWFVIDVRATAHARAELSARLAQLRVKHAEFNVASLPPAAAMAALKQRVTDINSVDAGRGQPLPALLAALEALLPEQVYLTNLSYRAQPAEMQLTAESARAESLTAFLIKLQSSTAFDEVLLMRQSQRLTAGAKRIEFELRLKEKI